MASLIPGYEYDIFISYRQKDNKGDRWVSEFVEALKTELESTFKEEISVYFDINPHDGLLETHDVDASLKDKLKCLVFIPIISRTYCDPKSFAWEHEFKAFVEQASQDKFGLKVKLPNGNVACRVLPIQIHELNSEDKVLIEKELGGYLRAVEFIYKEQGVNRPLTPYDDEKININKTRYRNQINKVANAIEEIISGLRVEPTLAEKEKPQHKESLKEVKKEEKKEIQEKPAKLSKRKLLIGSMALAVLLIIAAILSYPKIFKRDTLEKLRSSGERISVAVMPFQNMTNDTTWNIWQNGIQDMLISSLSNSPEELTVRQIESINNLIQSKGLYNYASITPSVASAVSQKLDANVFIYGSIKQAGSLLRINAQLIDSKTEEVFKTFQIDGIAEKIIPIIDTLSWKVNDFLIISKLKKEELPDYQHFTSTNSPEAYRNFIFAENSRRKLDFPTAINYYSQAIGIDSNFTLASLMLSLAYYNNGMYNQAQKWCLKVYEKRDQMPLQQKIYTNWVHALCFETPQEEIKYLRQVQQIDDQLPTTYWSLGNLYNVRLNQYDKAIPELEKSLELFNKLGSKPIWVRSYTSLGLAYHKTGQYKKEKQLYKKAELDFPDNPNLIYRQAILSLSEADTVLANQYIEKYISIRKDNSWSEAAIATSVAEIYSEADILNKAEDYYQEAISLEPENPVRLNNLAYFLIDKNRDNNEGLELIDKALKLRPDFYSYLHTKGWGLYKQGKYEEALNILEKSKETRPVYSPSFVLHLEAAKKAVVSQKNN